ncbi:hypothetical protein RHMOL_Rhmol11G0280200 [Rhododendron molle]|uniref:Uncharacterized protein n=1 Tax=Rhododendron molle TaxID=49168 RepID=A0ACC0LX55_RHOML|nr:hypothetical protein RHMOL_Rhmol11G0280200 [Rhododendron molle]
MIQLNFLIDECSHGREKNVSFCKTLLASGSLIGGLLGELTISMFIGMNPWLEPQQMQTWAKSFWLKNVVKLEREYYTLPFVINI